MDEDERESEDIRMARGELNRKYDDLLNDAMSLSDELEAIKNRARALRDMAEELGLTELEDKFLHIEGFKMTGW